MCFSVDVAQINAAVGCLARLPLPSPGGGGPVHRRYRGFNAAPAVAGPPSPGWRGRGAATASRLRDAWNPYLRHAPSRAVAPLSLMLWTQLPYASVPSVGSFGTNCLAAGGIVDRLSLILAQVRPRPSLCPPASCSAVIITRGFGRFQGDGAAIVCVCRGVHSDRALHATGAGLHCRIRAP